MSGERVLPICLAASLVITACMPSAPTPEPTSAPPATGGRFIHGVGADFTTLQPILDESIGYATDLIYAKVARPDPFTGELKPELARWEALPDRLTYRWTLDPKAAWSDGTPILASDWITGLRAVARSSRTTYKGAFTDIEGFADYAAGRSPEISGVRPDPASPRSWTVRFKVVNCVAVQRSVGYVLPSHVFGKYVSALGDAIDRAPENVAPPVASGPFRFVEWRQGDQIVLRRNERYWKGAPRLEEYVFKVIKQDALILALKSGEIDHGAGPGGAALDLVRGDPRFAFHTVTGLNFAWLGWNLRSPTAPSLAVREVRQALAYALDVDAIVRTLEDVARIDQPYAPTSWAWSQNDKPRRYSPAKAEELLRAAGYSRGADGVLQREGRKLAFTITAPAGMVGLANVAQIAAEQYRRIGVEVRVAPVGLPVMVEKLDTGSADIEAWVFLFRPPKATDPDTYASLFSSEQLPERAANHRGFNWSGYSDPRADRAIAEARTPADGDCSTSARKRHYATLTRLLHEDQPYLFLFVPRTTHIVPAALRSFDPGPFATYWNVEQWSLR